LLPRHRRDNQFIESNHLIAFNWHNPH
jgi:hypothetical protein